MDSQQPFTNEDNLDSKNIPCYKRFLLQIIEAIIILALIITVIVMAAKISSLNEQLDTPKKEEEKSKEIVPSYPVTYKQICETSPAKTVLIHVPNIELFMGVIHPAGSLAPKPSKDNEIVESFDRLKNYFYENNIAIVTVREALKKNKAKLVELAKNSVVYQKGTEQPADDDPNKEKYEYYLSDDYKTETLNQLSEDQLVDIITTKPTYTIEYIGVLTLVYSQIMRFTPTTGLLFCRDQQITTAKGVIIGHLYSVQRQIENDVLQVVFENIGATPIGRVTEGYLEGGDYFVAKKDLSMLGVGLRTSIEGAEYVMKNDLLGTRYMAVVYDDNDRNNDRMHLDTVFNIVSDEYVVLLDFSTVPDKTNIDRKVFLYDNQAQASKTESGFENIKSEYGKYKLIEKYDTLYSFLEKQGYKVIKITNQQQIDFMINFLNIGNNKILAVHKGLEEVVRKAGCTNVTINYIDFGAIQKLNGAAHCATQVSRT